MVSKPSNLANLVGKLLETYAASRDEIEAHLESAKDSMADARLPNVSLFGRFQSLYTAGHALAVAAYKIRGFRAKEGPGHRQGIFDALEHAVPATENDQQVFVEAHRIRNNSEYNGIGRWSIQQSTVEALQAATENLDEEVRFMYRDWLKLQSGAK